jgi:hypothetical protein
MGGILPDNLKTGKVMACTKFFSKSGLSTKIKCTFATQKKTIIKTHY